MLSFLYLGLRQIFEFLIMLSRSADRKELEILVLRHELQRPAPSGEVAAV